MNFRTTILIQCTLPRPTQRDTSHPVDHLSDSNGEVCHYDDVGLPVLSCVGQGRSIEPLRSTAITVALHDVLRKMTREIHSSSGRWNLGSDVGKSMEKDPHINAEAPRDMALMLRKAVGASLFV